MKHAGLHAFSQFDRFDACEAGRVHGGGRAGWWPRHPSLTKRGTWRRLEHSSRHADRRDRHHRSPSRRRCRDVPSGASSGQSAVSSSPASGLPSAPSPGHIRQTGAGGGHLASAQPIVALVSVCVAVRRPAGSSENSRYQSKLPDVRDCGLVEAELARVTAIAQSRVALASAIDISARARIGRGIDSCPFISAKRTRSTAVRIAAPRPGSASLMSRPGAAKADRVNQMCLSRSGQSDRRVDNAPRDDIFWPLVAHQRVYGPCGRHLTLKVAHHHHRATQKKMMSNPVVAHRRDNSVTSGSAPASRVKTATAPREPSVEHVLVAAQRHPPPPLLASAPASSHFRRR